MNAVRPTSRTRRRSRALAITLATAAAVATVGVTAATAAPGFSFSTRTGGATRSETAVATSKALYPQDGSATDVVIVNLASTVDGLSASYLAGLKNAPILYSDVDAMPSVTAAEIKRLGATHIWMVGGTSVLSQSLQDGLKKDYTVTRFAGDDRYGTAQAVAEAGPYQPERVYIASGTSLADAVVVSPIAWARNYPVLLTKADSVPAATAKALSDLGTTNRTVIGGTSVISDATAKALASTGRLAGANRRATAVAVADDAVATAGFTHANAALVGGGNNAAVDALSASSLAGNSGTPLLYTATADHIGDETAAYLKANHSELVPGGVGLVFGGTSAVSDDAVTEANAAAQ